MIDLYGMGSPNVLKIVLMLEELEAPYRFHYVKVWTGQQHSPEFLRLNPNAKAPVIVDPAGPDGPQTVFESGAILIYLAERFGRFLPASGRSRYEALQWLMIQLTGVGPMFGQYVHFTRFEPEVSPYATARYTSEAIRLVDLIEQRLSQYAYLGGDDYGVADIATFPWLNNLAFMKLPEDRPNVARWLEAIRARPAAGRLAAKVAELAPLGATNIAEATAEDRDRMYGRGRFARTA